MKTSSLLILGYVFFLSACGKADGTLNTTNSTSASVSTGNFFAKDGNAFGANAVLGTTDNFGLSFNTNNSPRMSILSDGKIGVGTAAPTAAFQNNITSLASTPAQSLTGNWFTGGSAVTTKPHFLIEPDGVNSVDWSTNGTAFGINSPSSMTGNAIDIKKNGVTVFSINSDGYTGTTTGFDAGRWDNTPYQVSSVAGKFPGQVLIRNSNWAAVDGVGTAYQITSINANGNFQNAYIGSVSDPNVGSFEPHLVFGGQVGADGYEERMRLDSTGNLGIGTSAPGARLDVADSGTATSAIIVPRAGAFTGTTVNGMLRYNSTSNLFEFYQNGSWVNYTTVSDARLKTNVVPVGSLYALGLVSQLQPVFYDWDKSNPRTKSFDDKHQVGFIAQDVEKVLPEVVDVGADSYRSVQYGKIVSVVVAAVQELYHRLLGVEEAQVQQSREIASVKEENQKLKQENAEMKARLEKIEKMLKAKNF